MFVPILLLFVSIVQLVKAGSPNYGFVSTFAGTDNTITGKSYGGDGGKANLASLNKPSDVALDGLGGLYVCDSANHIIRYIDSSYYINTIAGIPQVAGYNGDGSQATSATLNAPFGITYSKTFLKLYVADTVNHRVRLIDMSTGLISTVAGTGTSGNGGDSISATSCALNNPTSVTLDPDRNIYIADKGNHCIRKITTAGGGTTITTVAGLCGTSGSTTGDGTSARLFYPYYIYSDSNANSPSLYIADSFNHVIRRLYTKLSSGNMKVVAGRMLSPAYFGDGGAPTSAKLYYPLAISVDNGNSMIISDSYNNVIRKATNDSTPTIYTIVGDTDITFDDDSSVATSSSLNLPAGTDYDSTGIWLCDSNNNRIRKVTFAPSFAPTARPTVGPTVTPSFKPTPSPTVVPSVTPTKSPSYKPTPSPTNRPTYVPSAGPTTRPTYVPTVIPTTLPSRTPSYIPTSTPTYSPSKTPTKSPSFSPSYTPSYTPSFTPSYRPTFTPTSLPTALPTPIPTATPSTANPSVMPSSSPTYATGVPTPSPSTATPTIAPTAVPTVIPTEIPTETPTVVPTAVPTVIPTSVPSFSPTYLPTVTPTDTPSFSPSAVPTVIPTAVPTVIPTETPTVTPTEVPTAIPTTIPSPSPTSIPTSIPTSLPTSVPTSIPTGTPTSIPTSKPSSPFPTSQPSSMPSSQPTSLPTVFTAPGQSYFTVLIQMIELEYDGDGGWTSSSLSTETFLQATVASIPSIQQSDINILAVTNDDYSNVDPFFRPSEAGLRINYTVSFFDQHIEQRRLGTEVGASYRYNTVYEYLSGGLLESLQNGNYTHALNYLAVNLACDPLKNVTIWNWEIGDAIATNSLTSQPSSASTLKPEALVSQFKTYIIIASVVTAVMMVCCICAGYIRYVRRKNSKATGAYARWNETYNDVRNSTSNFINRLSQFGSSKSHHEQGEMIAAAAGGNINNPLQQKTKVTRKKSLYLPDTANNSGFNDHESNLAARPSDHIRPSLLYSHYSDKEKKTDSNPMYDL